MYLPLRGAGLSSVIIRAQLNGLPMVCRWAARARAHIQFMMMARYKSVLSKALFYMRFLYAGLKYFFRCARTRSVFPICISIHRAAAAAAAMRNTAWVSGELMKKWDYTGHIHRTSIFSAWKAGFLHNPHSHKTVVRCIICIHFSSSSIYVASCRVISCGIYVKLRMALIYSISILRSCKRAVISSAPDLNFSVSICILGDWKCMRSIFVLCPLEYKVYMRSIK